MGHYERQINKTDVKGKPFIENVFRPYFRFRKKGLESKFRKGKAIAVGPVAIRLKSVCIKQILCVKIFIFYLEKLQEQWLLYVPRGLTFTILRSAHTLYLCILCGSQNKQRLFPYTTLTDWFV